LRIIFYAPIEDPLQLAARFFNLVLNETGSFNIFPEIPLTHVGNGQNFR